MFCTMATDMLGLRPTPHLGQNEGWAATCGTNTAPSGDDKLLLTCTFAKSAGSPDISAGVLFRAGAFIALDGNAQYLFPSLPLASAHELAIAHQLGFTR